MKPLRILLTLLALLLSSLAVAAETLTLGVFSFRPKPVMIERYQPLADYLSEQLGDIRVELKILEIDEFENALAHREVDLLMTNPSHYLIVRNRDSLSGVLATLISVSDGQAVSSLGGVIITQAGRDDIARLSDLRHRRIAAPGTAYLGGYQTQIFEMQQAGIPLPRSEDLLLTGRHDSVIEAVLDGRADVGFVRTGIIESLAAEGKLDPTQLKVINAQQLAGFPYRVSTRLYPEWPFVALPHVTPDSVRRITTALFLLPTTHPAALAARIEGFAPPADYLPVENLARSLGVAPYDVVPTLNLRDVWQQYRVHLSMTAAMLVTTLVLLLMIFRRNTQLVQALDDKQALHKQLAANHERLDTLLSNNPSVIFALTPKTLAPTFVSSNALTLYGQPVCDILANPSWWDDNVHPDDLERSYRLMTAWADGGFKGGLDQSYRLRHANGQWRWIEDQMTAVRDADGTVVELVGSHTDVTERHQTRKRLELLASVFTHAREGIMITDNKGRIVDVNEAFSRITGYSRDEVLGNNPRMFKSELQDEHYYEDMWHNLRHNGYWDGEIWNRHKSGSLYAELLTIAEVRGDGPEAGHYVSLFSDITRQKENEKQLKKIAHFDALTGLPNRVLLADRLNQAMALARRGGQQLALAYIDIDGFKAVNDSHGHEVGDRLLVTLAERINASLREGDTVARLGGDEFVVVLADLPDQRIATELITRLMCAIGRPVQIDEQIFQVSVSIGLTFYPQAVDADPDQLLRQADQAMYHAKVAGKNRFHIFDTEHDASLRGRHEAFARIRDGLEQHEFVLYYQPKVNMRSGEVMGVEALIRWRHPQRGLLAPAAFLPLVAQHMLEIEIDRWVVTSALAQMSTWHAQGHALRVSVNITGNYLQNPDFIDELQHMLAAYPGVPVQHLELEVLETSALEDITHVAAVIEACRRIGVSVALDDFGTGYSSLTYLKRLAATTLKIDKSFVRDMLHDPDDLAILEGVLGLACAFRRTVIAEGVESVAHGKALLQLGCELAQGYVIARPLPAAALIDWINTWTPEPEWRTTHRLPVESRPLLYAGVEQRAWMERIKTHLNNTPANQAGHPNPPRLLGDPEQSHFSQWLDGLSSAASQRPDLQAIRTLYGQTQALGHDLIALRPSLTVAEIHLRLNDLQHLHTQFLEELQALTDA